MGKMVSEILTEIAQLQSQLDQAEQNLRDFSLTDMIDRIGQALQEEVSRHSQIEQELLEANKSLQASEARYRRIVETAEEGVWILDDHDRTVFVNHRMANMLGQTVEQMRGQPVTAFTDEEGSRIIQQALQRRRQGKRETYEMRFLRTNGPDFWALVCTSPILDEQGRYAGTLKMITDIDDRKRLREQIEDIAAREQQRIGRYLHDVLGQTLAGIAFLSKILLQQLEGQGRPEAQDVAEIASQVNLSMKQLRGLAAGLATVTPGPDGLRRALGEHVSDVESLHNVSCRFESDPAVRVADHEVATHLYHIAQEAVANAVKHGRATHITIRLFAKPKGGLDLQIENNGIDFPERATQTGLGLRIMGQRAGAIGARLRIQRAPAGGTVVSCSVPGTIAEAEVESRHGYATGNGE